jgi:transposase
MTSDAKHEITLHLPPALLAGLDRAARHLNRSRAEIIRQAIESHLEDCDDLTAACERLRDPGDPVLDWDRVRGGLLR